MSFDSRCPPCGGFALADLRVPKQGLDGTDADDATTHDATMDEETGGADSDQLAGAQRFAALLVERFESRSVRPIAEVRERWLIFAGPRQ